MAMSRYRDGYLHARAVNGFGILIKTASWIIGGLLVFGGLVAVGSGQDAGRVNPFVNTGQLETIIGILGILVGLIVGILGNILGVLVQSAGQSMKAHFDCAVNGSHFLNDDQRAEVMSLK
jgi:hypothetical protein